MASPEPAQPVAGTTTHRDPTDYLTKLISPTLENILATVRKRYANGDYFTKLGENALLVLGGSAALAESTAEVAAEYAKWIVDTDENKPDLPPHVFDMAASCFYHMTRDSCNQSVVFLGSDASEKSEIRKLFVWQLLMLSTNTQNTGDQKILRAATMMDPVFEAFAHARTLRSRSATMACKYVEYQYNYDWKLVGVGSIAFHLDGSRFSTTTPGLKEENYPIFYYILAGCTSQEKARWKLNDAAQFRYLQGSPFFHTAKEDMQTFHELQKALKHLRIGLKLQKQIWQVLAAILHLGNLTFVDDETRPQDPCSIANGEELFIVANLLGVEQISLQDALIYKSKVIGHERISLFMTAETASEQRNLLASTLYSELVAWLVRRMNACLCKSHEDEVAASIRVFEVPSFRENGSNELDRLLYNMVNENLHTHVLSWVDDQCAEYAQEGVLSFAVENQEERLGAAGHLLSMDIGLLRAIDEEAIHRHMFTNVKNADLTIPETILTAYDVVQPVPVDNTRVSSRYFQVQHYCGLATYDIDSLVYLDTNVLSSSVTAIFTGNSPGIPPCANGFVRNLFSKEEFAEVAHQRDESTVIADFSRQTHQVMSALKDAKPWFVVCVDSGESPLSDRQDVEILKADVIGNQIPQQVQSRVAGDYAAEYTHEEFISRFHSVVMESHFDDSDELDFANLCEDFASEMNWTEEHMALGLTKVFLSEKVWRYLHDRLRAFEATNAGTPWTAQPSDFVANLRRPITDSADTDSEMNMASSDAETREAPKPYEIQEIEPKKLSAARKKWLTCTWSLTWCFRPFCLKLCGRMTRKDVQIAWREKVALCMIIGFMCLFLLGFIIGLPKVLCPKQHILSLDEVRKRTDMKDPWVYGYGKAYEVSSLASRHLNDGISKFPNALGKDVSGLFYKVPYFAELCPGIQLPQAGWDNLPKRPMDYSLRHERPDSPYFQTLNSVAKKDIAYQWDYIHQQPLVNKSWIVLHDKVYDVSTYRLSPFFQDSQVDRMFANRLGQDITKDWTATVSRADPARARAIERCMDAMFYIGCVDHRLDLGCQFSNYVLLASSLVIIGVIGLKFLVAVQFTSAPKLDHSKLDQFVICQMPCYTEGESSLRKSLESLACMEYEGARKLLFVICDGMVVGSGNNRPTPRIVLDILGADPKHDPEAFVFQSVGDGDAQLNRAKVYSGLYSVKKGEATHTVPYIVVVKVGKESEIARPGNRGKRDSQLIVLNLLSRIHFDAVLCPLELELFRTMTEVIGIHPSQYSLLFYIDADTEVYPDALGQLVHTMTHDQSIIGLCGETVLSNESETWITKIQVYEYFISHHLTKAFEAIFGAVTCLPGCFCMYRIRSKNNAPLLIAPEVVDEFSQNDVDTLHLKSLFDLGEDRFLTTLVLKHFSHMKCTFVNSAKCRTNAPDKWKVLASQRRRWINSTVHNLFELLSIRQCGWLCCSMKFVVFLDLLSTVLQPAAMVYIGYLVYAIVSAENTLPIISIAMIAAVYGLQIVVFVLQREFKQIIWMILYIFGIPVFTFLLPLYAFWHFDDFSWGNTRIVFGEDGKKKKIAAETKKFDPASVPRMRWADYSKNKQLAQASVKQEQEMAERRRLSHRVMSYMGGAGGGSVLNRAVVLSNSNSCETLPQYEPRGRTPSPKPARFRNESPPVTFQYTNRTSRYTVGASPNLPHSRTRSRSPSVASGYASSEASSLNSERRHERIALENAVGKAMLSKSFNPHQVVDRTSVQAAGNHYANPSDMNARGVNVDRSNNVMPTPLNLASVSSHQHYPGATELGGYSPEHKVEEIRVLTPPPTAPERRSSMIPSPASGSPVPAMAGPSVSFQPEGQAFQRSTNASETASLASGDYRRFEHPEILSAPRPMSDYSTVAADYGYAGRRTDNAMARASHVSLRDKFQPPFAMERSRSASQLSLSSHKGKQPAGMPMLMDRRASNPSNINFPMPHPAERRASELSVGGLVRKRDFLHAAESFKVDVSQASSSRYSPVSPSPPTSSAPQPSPPSDEQIFNEVRRILETSDLMSISKKSVRDTLQQKFGVDLTHKKQFINEQIDELLDVFVRQGI
ncbi:chitin synthase-domain-containing protein [Powellomyces hirtus]|nr:chitin synthase-domain-containing protein [Powellomyces hirtus]